VYGKALIDTRMVKAAPRPPSTPQEQWLQTLQKLFETLMRMPKPKRRNGCRRGVAELRPAICNRRPVVTLAVM
jgi:hypothetical protein